eukprot:9988955-Prorocentrum_lima.AAC.1
MNLASVASVWGGLKEAAALLLLRETLVPLLRSDDDGDDDGVAAGAVHPLKSNTMVLFQLRGLS